MSIISPQRSNGTIMSPAVFSIRASIVRLAVPMRWFTPAGTASRTASSSAARRRSPGSASSVSSSTPVAIEQRGRNVRASDARPARRARRATR